MLLEFVSLALLCWLTVEFCSRIRIPVHNARHLRSALQAMMWTLERQLAAGCHQLGCLSGWLLELQGSEPCLCMAFSDEQSDSLFWKFCGAGIYLSFIFFFFFHIWYRVIWMELLSCLQNLFHLHATCPQFNPKDDLLCFAVFYAPDVSDEMLYEENHIVQCRCNRPIYNGMQAPSLHVLKSADHSYKLLISYLWLCPYLPGLRAKLSHWPEYSCPKWIVVKDFIRFIKKS